jgi:hypothetical protein
MKSSSSRMRPGRPKRITVCGMGSSITIRRAPRAARARHRPQLGALRQVAEDRRAAVRALAASMSPTTATTRLSRANVRRERRADPPRRSPRRSPACPGPGANRGDRRTRPRTRLRPAIALGSCSSRRSGPGPARARSTASASKRGSERARRSSSKPLVAVLRQRAHAAVEGVAPRAEGELDIGVAQPLLEGLRVEIAGALVEQAAGDHVGDAGQLFRILRRAAAEGDADADQRDRGLGHEPGLDAAGRDHALDVDGVGGRGGGEAGGRTVMAAIRATRLGRMPEPRSFI